ncbi:MAG: nuclease [Planctomycetes bacterium]|nr:nuclease [Planctomycetota bacterium]
METILADDRERDSRVPEWLARCETIELKMARLSCGDYALGTRCGIERKTAEDLALSIVDGRLFRQMNALRLRYDRPLLLIEGLTPGSSIARVPWHAIQGALVSAAAVFGVPVLHAADAEESARLIVTAARQLERSFSDGYARPGYRPKGFRKRALFILQGLSRVGPKRAAALFDAFGSVRAVMTAEEGALEGVPWIGPSIARSILRAVGPDPTKPGARVELKKEEA